MKLPALPRGELHLHLGPYALLFFSATKYMGVVGDKTFVSDRGDKGSLIRSIPEIALAFLCKLQVFATLP